MRNNKSKMISQPISRVLSWTVIHLDPRSLEGSSDLTRVQRGPRFIQSKRLNRTPIWSCSKRGLPCHCCCQQRGALLPHHFTLTEKIGGIFSVALSVDFHLPDVIWRFVLWSPDFPLQISLDLRKKMRCKAETKQATVIY